MKGFCDQHIHSRLSLDGRSTLMEQVRACREVGVMRVCFTEHIDFGTQGGDFTVDFGEYARQIEAARAAFPDMKIRIGLELGDTEESRERVLEQSNVLPLDFKLLSRHLIGGVDPYFGMEFFAHRTRAQAAREYCEAVYESVTQFPDYDAVAHIGYVFKFAQGDGFSPLCYRDEPDLIDATLRFMAEHGKALEVNTSRWERFGEGMPGADILARFREQGGELVTIGSDAHDVAGVAQGFSQAVDCVKACGFGYIAEFMGREVEMVRV